MNNNNKVMRFLTDNTVIPILVIILIIGAIMAPNFLTIGNILNVFNQNSIKGIMAIGMTFVIINGYFDMSLCTLVSFSAGLVCGMQANVGLFGAIIIAVLAGVIVGVINGFLVAHVGINAFVSTLALMLVCRGLTYVYSNSESIVSESKALVNFGTSKIAGITYTGWLYIIGLIIAHFVLRYTMHGRNTYAAGGNANAAANAGIDVKKTTFINFLICGTLSGLGGVLYAAMNGSSTPALGWPDMHMLVIAGCVLGGIKLTGGVGNIWYSLAGIMVLGFVFNIMNLCTVQSWVSTMLTGIIMIAVLYADKVLTERKEKESLKNLS